MATGGQEKGGVPDYDECPVCRECLRDPRTLNCAHYFCRVCLEGIIGDNLPRSLKCPTCREIMEVPEGSGVSDLPSHEGKYSFQDQVAGFLSGANNNNIVVKRDCDICEDGALATIFCYQCMNDMCKECENIHQQKTKTHKIVPLVDLLFCSTHANQILNMFCQECNMSVCIKCAFYEHTTHQTVDIDGVAKQSRQRLQDFVETHSDLDDYQSTLEHVMSAQGEARKLENEYTYSLYKTRRLLKKLDEKLDQVGRDTKNKMAAEIKLLSLYETDIKDMMESRKSLIDHATYLVQQASDPELVEREKDFPRPRVEYTQNIDSKSFKIPVLENTFTTIWSQIEQIMVHLQVKFKERNIDMSRKLEIEDLQKQHTIQVGHTMYGVTMDTKHQSIVARTSDTSGPIKVYSYQGGLQKTLGAGVRGLATGNVRGICMDTKRDYYMAPCSNKLVLVNRDGQLVKSISVGNNITGVAYHKDGDCYLVSDTGKHTVYLMDPDTSRVTKQIGPSASEPTELNLPYCIHAGLVTGKEDPCIVVCDSQRGFIKIFDITGQHVRTYGSRGYRDGQINYSAFGVITDPRGRVVVCDSGNNRVVIFSTDTTGQEKWECILQDDWGGRQPYYMALDSDNMVMAIVDSTCKKLHIYE